MKVKLKRKTIAVYFSAFAVIIVLMFLSLWIGESAYKTTFSEMFKGLFTGKNPIVNMFVDIRGPRTITAVIVGMCLAVAGVLLQAVTRNELADAGIIGVSSSAYFGHLICAMFMSRAALVYSPLIAFIFGMLVFCGVLYLSWSHGIKSNKILLVGIAFNTVMVLLNLTVILMSGLTASSKLMSFIGSLNIPSDSEVISTAVFSAVGLLAAILLIPKCNLLSLGDKTAAGLGVKVNLLKVILVVIAVFLCSIATKMVGITSFIGLLAPICARKLLGNNYKHVIPLSALFGGLFVLGGDFIGRCIMNQPFSMPVGVITSLIGGIVFLIMLKRN